MRFLGYALSIAGAGFLLGACDRPPSTAATPASTTPPLLTAAPAIDAKECRVQIELNPAGPIEATATGPRILTATITNKGNTKWGGGGPPMQLGAVWFAPGKIGEGHLPNSGEQWWPLPAPLGPGETIKFDITLDVAKPNGQFRVWFSMLQPGVMWCFHVGHPATKLGVTVGRSS